MANIAVRRKSGFIMRDGGRRRETLWLGGIEVQSTLAAASTAAILTSLSAAGLALRPFTIVRTRGYLYLRSDQIAVAEYQSVAYGQCVVSDQAVSIGVTAVPTPVTDNFSDLWYVYERIMNDLMVSSSGVGAGNFITSGRGFAFDSKAMRKVEDGQDVVSVAETAATSDGSVLNVFDRILVKLH